MKLKAHFVAIFCLAFAVTGCIPAAELYVGKPVTTAPVVKLQKGANPVAGTWQTFDMTINYTYTAKGESLEIAGQGELSQHYQLNYDGVRSLRVYLFLLNVDGVILETVEIPVFLIDTEDQFTFNLPFKGNEDIKGFSFGYSGVASESNGQKYFDKLP